MNAEDIRDIKGMIEPDFTWFFIFLVIALLLLLALWWWNKRKSTPLPPVPETPSERALRLLAELQTLVAQQRVKELAFETSSIFRNYLNERFCIKVVEKTTDEFLQELPQLSSKIPHSYHPLFQQCLREFDMVKYAGAALSLEDAQRFIEQIRTFIIQSSPPPPLP